MYSSSSSRLRSGSVGPSARDPAPYRTSYGRSNEGTGSGYGGSMATSRLSRASSYDPFSSGKSRIPMPSSTFNTHTRYGAGGGSGGSGAGSYGMSSSYHSDYTPRSYGVSRYGSTDALSSSMTSSSTYKSPYSNPSGMSSSYRSAAASDTYRERPSYRASSTFTPRSSGYSESRSARDYTPISRDYTSSSTTTGSSGLSKYRPDATTSYSRPSYSTASSYAPRVRFDYRSKTPGCTTSSDDTSSAGRSSRFDRDYKSMSRFEKSPVRDNSSTASEKSDKSDEVEETFQKLYNRYVKDVDANVAPPTKMRQFISHSEAEEEEEESCESGEDEDSFAETLRQRGRAVVGVPAASLTPRQSHSPNATPKSSPLPKKREALDGGKAVAEPSVPAPKSVSPLPVAATKVPTTPAPAKSATTSSNPTTPAAKVQTTKTETVSTKKDEPVPKSAAESFKERHGDVEMTAAVIPTRDLKPATSAMDRMLRRDSLTTKLTDAIEKKKSPTPSPREATPSAAAAAKTAASLLATPNVQTAATKAASPAPKTAVPAQKMASPAPKMASPAPKTASPAPKTASPAPKTTNPAHSSMSKPSSSPTFKNPDVGVKTPTVGKSTSPAPKTATTSTLATPTGTCTSKSLSPAPSTKAAESSSVKTATKSASPAPSAKEQTTSSTKPAEKPAVTKSASPAPSTKLQTTKPEKKAVSASPAPDANKTQPTKAVSPVPTSKTQDSSATLAATKTATLSKSTSPSPAKSAAATVTKALSPTVSKTVSDKTKSAIPAVASTAKDDSAKSTKSPSPAPSKAKTDVEAGTKVTGGAAATTATGSAMKLPIGAAASQEKESPSSSGETKSTRVKPTLTIDTKAAEEPTADVTIVIPKQSRSRSSSPARERSKSRESRETREGSSSQFLEVRRSPSPRRSKDGSKMRRSASPSSAHLTVDREERSKSEDVTEKKVARKRRDPTRTLECLKEKLEPLLQEKRKAQAEREDSEGSEGKETVAELPSSSRVRPPLLLVTQPSMPSTPLTTTGSVMPWQGEGSSENEWTEAEDEADYESDFEYSISQTFRIPDKVPLGDLYPLSPSSSRCSPYVSDYDSDSSMPFLVDACRAEDSRGRVNRLFAVPPPTFTCSITYDGQESWDEDEQSVHSCEDSDDDYDDVYTGRPISRRPGSSSLGVYLSPATYSSDEDYDGSQYHDSVQVGCTLKLVDRAAMRDSEDDEEYTDSEYYDDEEYSDEEYWDEDEEEDVEYYDEDEEEYEYEDEEMEEEEEEEEEEEMHSMMEDVESRMSPLIVAQTASLGQEDMEFEEMDGDFEAVTSFEMAEPLEVTGEEETANKYREVTYTKDLSMMTAEEKAEQLEVEKEKREKAVAKKILKDGTTGKAEKSQTAQRVLPSVETVAEAELSELPEETLVELGATEHQANTGSTQVSVVPSFVRPQTEKLQEESTSRFADKKPSTDFAKKAVIQPTKLETAKVQKVETKLAVEPKKAEPPSQKASDIPPAMKKLEDEKRAAKVVEEQRKKEREAAAVPKAATTSTTKSPTHTSIVPAKKEETTAVSAKKELEDKSAVRKSALNMTTDEAKKKAKADEEAAKQKARRLGTVSSLMDRFKEEKKEPEPIVYKRSSRLQPKDEERPRRKYEIVKPVINDEFDKQMEELRAQMKAGSSQFQDQLKNLSKGISTVSEEAKKRELEEKHKNLIDKTSGVFSKADEEKMRWKEKRDADTERELAKIEADKAVARKKTAVAAAPKPEEPVKKEPKRTIRKLHRDKSPAPPVDGKEASAPAVVPAPSFATTPKTTTAAAPAATKTPAPKTPAPSTSATPTAPTTKTPGTDAKTTAKTETPAAPPAPPVLRDMFKREKTPVVKPADVLKKPEAPKQELVIDDSNYALFAAATAVATKRRKSLIAMKKAAADQADGKAPEPGAATSAPTVTQKKVWKPPAVPKAEGAAATKIRNAVLGNATNVVEKSPAGSERSAKRYSSRRKTQEIVNESAQPKRRRKLRSRRNRFIRDPHDIDIVLGWGKELTFDMMEKMFSESSSDKRPASFAPAKKRRRYENGKIWISDLTDIDKIYKASEIRDILASAEMG